MSAARTSPQTTTSQPQDAAVAHRVVWQVADGGVTVHQRLLRNLTNLLDELQGEGVEVEVIAHGPGLALLLAQGTAVHTLACLRDRGVVFRACANTLRSRHLTSADLVDDALIVPSGVAAVVRRQGEGWSYLRA